MALQTARLNHRNHRAQCINLKHRALIVRNPHSPRTHRTLYPREHSQRHQILKSK